MNENFDLKAFLSENPWIAEVMRRAHLRTGIKIALVLAGITLSTVFLIIWYGPLALLFGLLFAILLLLLWKPWRVFGRARTGLIEQAHFEMRRISRTKNPGNVYETAMVSFLCCTCLDAQGKRFSFLAEQRYETVYHKGDLVLKLPELSLPINLNPGDYRVCPYCGQIFSVKIPSCTGCGRDGVKYRKDGLI